MKIAIIGYGNMGHEIEKAAIARGIAVKSIIDPNEKNATHAEINEKSVRDVDVCIDFTSPKSALGNAEKISKLGKNIVIGTTGWYGDIGKIRNIAKKSDTGIIYSPNFSVGINVFLRIVENAARLINRIEDYDIYGYELHHSKKIDSPSGTAKSIGGILIKNIKRKNELLYDKIDRKIKPNELHFASVRAGSIPGTHVVGFDSQADTIELKHTARNREGFALGAIMAAQWIKNKKGFYNFNDVVENILGVR